MMAELPTRKVRIDPERLLDLATEWMTEHPVGQNSRSPLSHLAVSSGLSVAQLEGRTPVALWMVESLAVLIKCLPQALIVQPERKVASPKAAGTAASNEEVTMPDKEYRYHCPIRDCHWMTDSAQGLRIHRGRDHGTPEAKKIVDDYIAKIDGTSKERLDGMREHIKQVHEQLEKTPDPLRTTALPDILSDPQPADDPLEHCPSDVEPKREECSEAEPETPVDEIKPFTVTPVGEKPKTKMLTVEVKATEIPVVKAMLLHQEQVIDVLAERVAELMNQRRRLFSKAIPWNAVEMRDWAEHKLDQRKREDFRARMQEVIDDMEHALFDAPDAAEDVA